MSDTGRKPDHKPALQNIPIRTETGRAVRDALTSRPIVGVDYASIEIRAAFASGLTTEQIGALCGLSPEEIREMRERWERDTRR